MKKNTRRYLLLFLLALGVLLHPGAPLSPHSVYAQSAEAQALISRIDGLPPIEDIGEPHALEVKALMETYAGLPMSEQIHVKNYDSLKNSYDRLVDTGFITNEMQAEIEEQQNLALQQSNKKDSGRTSAQETEYNFTLREKEQITIMLRYTTDTDGDGTTDVPDRITLTSPFGNIYPVSNAALALKDADLNNALTWTDNYLQTDIAEAAAGTWTIQTSVPVTFSSESYKGAALPIEAEGSGTEELADSAIEYDEDGNPIRPGDEEEEKSGGGFLLILLILLLLGGLGAIAFVFLRGRRSQTPGGRDGDVIDAPRPLSDEEVMDQMRRDYEKQIKEEEMQDLHNSDPAPKDTYVPDVGRGKNRYMDDEDLEDIGEDSGIDEEEFIQEYREGETGLLNTPPKKEEEPDEESSIFSDFDD